MIKRVIFIKNLQKHITIQCHDDCTGRGLCNQLTEMFPEFDNAASYIIISNSKTISESTLISSTEISRPILFSAIFSKKNHSKTIFVTNKKYEKEETTRIQEIVENNKNDTQQPLKTEQNLMNEESSIEMPPNACTIGTTNGGGGTTEEISFKSQESITDNSNDINKEETNITVTINFIQNTYKQIVINMASSINFEQLEKIIVSSHPQFTNKRIIFIVDQETPNPHKTLGNNDISIFGFVCGDQEKTMVRHILYTKMRIGLKIELPIKISCGELKELLKIIQPQYKNYDISIIYFNDKRSDDFIFDNRRDKIIVLVGKEIEQIPDYGEETERTIKIKNHFEVFIMKERTPINMFFDEAIKRYPELNGTLMKLRHTTKIINPTKFGEIPNDFVSLDGRPITRQIKLILGSSGSVIEAMSNEHWSDVLDRMNDAFRIEGVPTYLLNEKPLDMEAVIGTQEGDIEVHIVADKVGYAPAPIPGEEEKIKSIVEMGFSREIAQMALKKARGDVSRAVNILI